MQGILPQPGFALALQCLAALLYAMLSMHFWRRYWAAPPAAAADHSGHLLQFAALSVHAAAVFGSILAGDTLRIGVGDAISAILWLTVLIYGAGGLFYPLQALQALVMPLAAVAVLLPALLPAAKIIPNTELPAFRLHLAMSMLAYSLFTIASLHVMLMAMLERRLHRGVLAGVLHRLPPLLTMETLLFRIICAGFITLTLTLASGIVFSEEVFGRAAHLNHKTLFGFISWSVFGALLAGRRWRGWRGRTAVRWTLAGFLLLILAYLGSKFVLEVLLGRV